MKMKEHVWSESKLTMKCDQKTPYTAKLLYRKIEFLYIYILQNVETITLIF